MNELLQSNGLPKFSNCYRFNIFIARKHHIVINTSHVMYLFLETNLFSREKPQVPMYVFIDLISECYL